MKSALYEGVIVHHRFTPVDHRFAYRLALPLIDLDELEELCRLHPLWSVERHNVISFWRRDYLPDRPGPLADVVRDLVEERLGRRPSGPVAMLAHPRTWGWLFNPIALYYCFDPEAARVEALVAEVTNTPWHERHVYVVGEPGRHRFAKELHVSPFFDMGMDYTLAYAEPGDRLSLSMRTVSGDKTLFRAGLRLQRHEANRQALARLVWGHPFSTMRVSAGIYREAFSLWRAGTPFVPHPGRRSEAPQPRRLVGLFLRRPATPDLPAAAPSRVQHRPLFTARRPPTADPFIAASVRPSEKDAAPSLPSRTKPYRRSSAFAGAVVQGPDPAGPGADAPNPAAASAPTRSTATCRLARTAVTALGRRLAWGTIVLEDPAGTLRLGDHGPEARVSVHHPGTYGALLRHGSVGFGRSYVDGWWDSDDLTDLVRVLVRNRGALGRARDRAGEAFSVVADPVRRLSRPSPATDRRDVRAHYDIGNGFFSLMLDPTLSYSCAVFERPGMTLEEASVAKLDRICRKLALSPADHVLEIGTGWGGFAVHAATRYGCRVTSTTISAEQYSYAKERVSRAGLSERVTIIQEDYRDLSGQYDRLVSIEMVEAVDWRVLGTYFKKCASLLRPDGLMALQAITIADQSYERAKNSQDFIKAFIFPGSCLPSVGSLAGAVARTDMRVVDLEDIGRHYAETLRHWRHNVDERQAEVEDLGFDARFLRMWRLYLSYCEAAFLERHISDVQLVFAKPAWRAPLLVRG
ncbi:MAG: DUF1365 family protein [Acidimicrobiales bacterium]